MTLITRAAFLATFEADPMDLMEDAFVTSPENQASVIQPMSNIMVAVDITSSQK
jgi:hypothetical protein